MDPALKLGLIMLCMLIVFAALITIGYLRAAFNAGKGDIAIGLVAMNAPRFWHHWPPADDNKVYVAEAGIQTDCFVGLPRKSVEVRGVRAAYLEARRLANQVENEEQNRNPRMSAYADGSYPNSVGVWWVYKEKEEGNV